MCFDTNSPLFIHSFKTPCIMTTKSKQAETMTPVALAFNKLYFVNLIGLHKFDTFYHAEITGNRAAQIANKLTGKELEYLISHIEDLM